MKTFLGIGTIIVGGWIIADLATHPKGVNAIGSNANSLFKTTAQGVTGQKVG